MDTAKKQIKSACKKASYYKAWRNPFKVWFVTLFNDKDEPFFEFQYSDDFPKREKAWVDGILNKIDSKGE